MRNKIAGNWFLHLTMLIANILIFVPVLWVVMNSFKNSKDILTRPFYIPRELEWSNYMRAWTDVGLGSGFINSVIITIITVSLIVLCSAMAAYTLSHKDFKLKKTIYVLFIMGLMLPTFLAMTPLFLLVNDMGLLNNHLGLIFVYVAFSLSFTIFMLTAFFSQIPKTLEEAAVIDGCGPFKLFFSIMFPLAKPGLVTAAIFNIVGIWNEYVIALILISSDGMKTLPVKLANLMMIQQYRTDWGALYAGIVLSFVPIIIFYIFFQRKLIEGSTAGAIKE